MSTPSMSIDKHPDLVALRDRYDEMSENPAVQLGEGLLLLSGLYVTASAWIVGFSGQTALAMCNLFAGLAVALMAVGFTSAYGRLHGLAFVAPLLGIWMIVSPWVVQGIVRTPGMIWSNVIGGAIVCVLGLGVTGMGMMRSRR